MDDLSAQVKSYIPSHETKAKLKHLPLLLLVGPTGSGKNTLENELAKTGQFLPIVTHTNRMPRENNGVLEKDGDEYHFISNVEALRMLQRQSFIEAAITHGNLYATSLTDVLKANNEGKIGVADIDVKGVLSYRALSDKVTAIFLLPPSFDVLIQRLLDRYAASHDQTDMIIRLKTALYELKELASSDFYHILINNDKTTSASEVIAIVDGKLNKQNDEAGKSLAASLIEDIQGYIDANS